jgi:hypothetical protein
LKLANNAAELSCIFDSTRGCLAMTDEKEFIERKKHKRFRVKNGAIAMIRTLSAKRDMSLDENPLDTKVQYCQIKSINKHGLVLFCIDKNGGSEKTVEIDLLYVQDSICFTYLKNVPVKTVGVSQVGGNTSSSDIKTIERVVQFGQMTLYQESQLDRFIKKYKIM